MAESYRAVAILMGWIVAQSEGNPARVPVLYRRRWMYLDDCGNLLEAAA
jgi:hypothetical protein